MMRPFLNVQIISRLAASAIGLAWLGGAAGPPAAHAAGTGLNVAVVVNTASSNSLALGNYYCERRGVPPENVVRIDWPGSAIEWGTGNFSNTLLNPLLNALVARGLSNQIDYVVLAMDIPYRTVGPGLGANGTTTCLFYDFKGDPRDPYTCPMATNSQNSYAFSERAFHTNKPATASGWSFLTTLITGNSLAEAKAVVDAGVAGDGTFPTNLILLEKTSDIFRNVRFYKFDNALLNLRLRAGLSAARTNSDVTSGLGTLFGFNTGRDSFSLTNTSFAPGGVGDHLTSFGGMILESTGQTTALEFLRAGAAGSYGTVIEPCNYLEKFTDPMVHFYQVRGFTLAEAYHQSVLNPYEGIVVGEPLSAPFRHNATVFWNGLASNTILTGATNLTILANSATNARPIQKLELFIDGKFFQTVTNIAPAAGNVLNVTIKTRSMNYTVPSGATLESVAAGLTAVLNNNPNPSFTDANGFQIGDRIELRAIDETEAGVNFGTSVNSSQGSAPALTTFVTAARANFLDTAAFGLRSYTASGTTGLGDILSVLVTKTNASTVTIAVTNTSGAWSLADHVGALYNQINATASLQGGDGLVAEDFLAFSETYFNLRARTAGGAAAQIIADFSFTAGLFIQPSASLALNEQLSDLQARNHLYISAGRTNLNTTFALITTNLADGFHELTAVACEGTHVQTQTRVSIPVIVSNNPFAATLTLYNAAAVMALETNFTAEVTTTGAAVAETELFSTGGSLGVVVGANPALFSVTNRNLGAGLHPFFAVVTTTGGKSFRTATQWVRFIGPEPEISAWITLAPPIQLTWPGVVGRRYDVFSADTLGVSYTLRDTVIATNPIQTLWSETNLPPVQTQRFYKVGVSP